MPRTSSCTLRWIPPSFIVSLLPSKPAVRPGQQAKRATSTCQCGVAAGLRADNSRRSCQDGSEPDRAELLSATSLDCTGLAREADCTGVGRVALRGRARWRQRRRCRARS
eukprot:6194298-Pleurochrysis_carterae.AAC.2